MPDHYRFIARHLKAAQPAVYRFKAKIWLWRGGGGSWHFLTVPLTTSRAIKTRHGHAAKGWGSHPVSARIGETSWRTSIFPYKKVRAFILPIKAEVRKREKLVKGDSVPVELTIGDLKGPV